MWQHNLCIVYHKKKQKWYQFLGLVGNLDKSEMQWDCFSSFTLSWQVRKCIDWFGKTKLIYIIHFYATYIRNIFNQIKKIFGVNKGKNAFRMKLICKFPYKKTVETIFQNNKKFEFHWEIFKAVITEKISGMSEYLSIQGTIQLNSIISVTNFRRYQAT